MQPSKLNVAVVGGLGLMASPMARHWKDSAEISVARVHDRGTPGSQKDKCRQQWRDHGAELVDSLAAVAGDSVDGVFVCCGKNGDDLPVIAALTRDLARIAPGAFICHMSTVSTAFVRAAHEFAAPHGIRYVNYPLTGGPAGAENATMLILASGDLELYKQLEPSLSLLGSPRHFGASITAGAEVKLMGQTMVFHGLAGICSALAVHGECLNEGKIGGESQSAFFDFLNAGAGGTRQWDVIARWGIRDDVWTAPFFMRYGVVDAIYAAQMCLDSGVSRLAADTVLKVALAFSYVINSVDPGLATQALAREMIASRAQDLDKFIFQHYDPRADAAAALARCVASLPADIQKSVALSVTAPDFEVSR